MSASQIAKYEAWILRIEALQEKDVRHRPLYFRAFVALPVVACLGFLGGPWIGVAAVLTGSLMSAFGFYSFLMIEGDYARELEGLRRSAADLRAAEAAALRPEHA